MKAGPHDLDKLFAVDAHGVSSLDGFTQLATIPSA